MADLLSILDEADLNYVQNTMDSHYELAPAPPIIVLPVQETVEADETQPDDAHEDTDERRPQAEVEAHAEAEADAEEEYDRSHRRRRHRSPTPPPERAKSTMSDDVLEHLRAHGMQIDEELLRNPPAPQQQQQVIEFEPEMLTPEEEKVRRDNRIREEKADLITDMQTWAEACKSLNRLEKEEDLFALPLPLLQDKHASWNVINSKRKRLKMARDIWCAICTMTGFTGERFLKILQIESPVEIMRMVRMYCAQVLIQNIADEPLRALCKYLLPTQSVKIQVLDLIWTFVSWVHEEWRRQQQIKEMHQKKMEAEQKRLETIEHEQLIKRAQAAQSAMPTMQLFNNTATSTQATPPPTTTTTRMMEVPQVHFDDAQKALRDLNMEDDDDDEDKMVATAATTTTPNTLRRSTRYR